MRLYLSSYKIGDYPDRLLDLMGNGRKACIIANALDNFPEAKQKAYRKRATHNPYTDLANLLGNQPEPLDLRTYFGHTDRLKSSLQSYDLVWIIGGNSFLLLYAMVKSGFDCVIRDLLHQDTIVYGGFSAGACVATPTLKGIDLMDHKLAVPELYDCDPVWDALGLVDFSIVPHYQSDHRETEMADTAVAYMEKEGMPFKTLSDGGVIVKQGERVEVLPAKLS